MAGCAGSSVTDGFSLATSWGRPLGASGSQQTSSLPITAAVADSGSIASGPATDRVRVLGRFQSVLGCSCRKAAPPCRRSCAARAPQGVSVLDAPTMLVDPQALGDRAVGPPLRRQQHDPGSLRQRLRGAVPAPQRLELATLGLHQIDRHRLASCHPIPRLSQKQVWHEIRDQDTRGCCEASRCCHVSGLT